jgi:hypothetical protein
MILTDMVITYGVTYLNPVELDLGLGLCLVRSETSVQDGS